MSTTVISLALCLSAALAIPASVTPCEKHNCSSAKGPLKLYKDLQCKPVFEKTDDCCPERYDCSHIDARSSDKCYAFGKEYSYGDEFKADTRGCLPPCVCRSGPKNTVNILCFPLPPQPAPKPGCYRPRNATNCGLGTEICFGKPEDLPTCQVDGRIIKAGHYFASETEPKKACWCNPGLNDTKDSEVYCEDRTEENCGAELYHEFDVRGYCAPVFTVGQSPGSDCNHEWICPEPDDKIIPRHEVEVESDDNRCKFGRDMTLYFADEIHRVHRGRCIKCSCNVPPFLTCWSFPKEDCSRTSLRKP